MLTYCVYCGRVAHRCRCAAQTSDLQQFLARSNPPTIYQPLLMETPYKRGVPPQIKRRERNTMRREYDSWFAQLCTQCGSACSNCGATSDDSKLVLDHILPIAKGGLSRLDNLQLLCRECNRIKGKLWIDCRKQGCADGTD